MRENERTKVHLQQLSAFDGALVYRLLQRIPRVENGFYNMVSGLGYHAYKQWLLRQEEIAAGIDLEDGMVEQTIYWLYAGYLPIGIGKLRHRLTPELRETGGNISYSILEKYRGRGYGKVLLGELLKEARRLELEEILVTAYSYNKSSIHVALHNGGQIIRTTDTKTYLKFPVKKEGAVAD